jgi:2-polyprenyl-3-methyl-5-hydroxy-6-metoxy-1,4-benzoquinol methylase
MVGKNVNQMHVVNTCPVCGSTGQRVFGHSEDYLVSKEVFTLVQCSFCDFVFTNPRPTVEILPSYYKSEDYISHTDSRKGIFEKVYGIVKHYMLKRKYLIIKKITGKKRYKILDYGCATGDLLLYLQNRGAICVGYEPDEDARSKAKEKGVSVISKDYDLLTDPYRNRFDIVTLWHVLEHIPDLEAKVQMFSGILDENGAIVVAVPEYKSYDAKHYGFKWAAWDVPRHLNHFETKTLQMLFEKNGFIFDRKYPLVFDSFYVSMLTEKNKNSRITGMLKAAVIGFYSNFKALLGSRPYSSQIYIFRKQS